MGFKLMLKHKGKARFGRAKMITKGKKLKKK